MAANGAKEVCSTFLSIASRAKAGTSYTTKKYSVKPNQMFILPAHVAHRYGTNATNPWTIYWLHFMGSRAQHFLDFLQQETNAPPITVSPPTRTVFNCLTTSSPT